MNRPPLRVLLLSDGPEVDAPSYLEMVLAQGGFQVTRDGQGDGEGHDAVLLSTSRTPRLDQVPADPAVPVIVLPDWRPSGWEVEAMVCDGAEDVLPLADLNAPRLESAVRKAVGRRARMPRRIPLREALAGLVTDGVPVHPWATTGAGAESDETVEV